MPFIIIVVIIVLAVIVKGIKIVPQSKALVIERLGTYKCTLESGLHLINPILDRVSSVVNLKEQLLDFPPKDVITKDNVTMKIDTVVYFQIMDPKLYTYGIERPVVAIENLTATTLRNIVGEIDLDQTLTSRDIINTKMLSILDEATDKWGIKIIRVEVKNIMPPEDIKNSMEKQMRAERERREAILRAEGEKKSSILIAEGEKESAILRADAQKESQIRIAEGEAEALLKIKRAEAQGLRLLKEAGADDKVLKLKAYDTLSNMANGQATTIVVPAELQGLVSSALTVKETFKGNQNQNNKKEN